MKNLKFIKDTTWDEVFNHWKRNEGKIKAWREFAVKEKGWKSWEEWRQYQASLYNARNRQWQIYEILKPNQVIPSFQVGPFPGWQQHYSQKEKNTHTFKELVEQYYDWIKQNKGVQKKINNFPKDAIFQIARSFATEKLIIFSFRTSSKETSRTNCLSSPIYFSKFSPITTELIPSEFFFSKEIRSKEPTNLSLP